jgi:hypothetical protein
VGAGPLRRIAQNEGPRQTQFDASEDLFLFRKALRRVAEKRKAMRMTMWVKGGDGDLSVTGFRYRNGSASGPMSLKLYNSLKRRGLGPKESIVGSKVVVFPEHERAWREARANPTGEEAARVAELRAKWHRRALAAGRAAAASPIHVSKAGRQKRPAQSKQRRSK